MDVYVALGRSLVVGCLVLASCRGVDDRKDFTIIALPDTQNYVSFKGGGTPDIFEAQTRWIAANRDSLNIVFVTHLGDFVQNGDSLDSEWEYAERAMSVLEDPVATGLVDGIPYGIVVGNHDQSPLGDARGTTRQFNDRFGVDRFRGRSYYGGHYGDNNDNHFELFNAGGKQFVFLHLEYDLEPSPAVLAWADSILVAYSDRYAFLSTHYLIELSNPAPFGPQGAAIFDALNGNPNLFMMFGGHIAGDVGEGQRTDSLVSSTVHSILSDYQSYANGGDGWLRIMHFYPSENRVTIQTFSPSIHGGAGGYIRDKDSEFELAVDFALLD